METEDMNCFVEGKVKEAMQANNAELLHSIGDMISKISAPSSSSSLNPSVLDAPKFKRKSNEEQYKQNHKVTSCLKEAEDNLDKHNVDAAKQFIIEAKDLVRRMLKLVQLADTSELGWRTVAEYEANPIASDSEDEKRIHKAEARASRKVKTERARKRPARRAPYVRSRPRAEASNDVQVSAVPQQRHGLCFLCGKPGHWKNECLQRTRTSNNKISKVSCILEFSEREVTAHGATKGPVKAVEPIVGKTLDSPVGRLKKSVGKWKQVTDSVYIIDVVENGYKLPFIKEPSRAHLKNNKSARDNSEFVMNEISSLIKKGEVSEVDFVPRVVNPLTVAFSKSGKPRLVLDCRHINPFLHLFKIKFEDIKIAVEMFDLYSYIFTFDLKSAYHHIDIFPDHRTFLGFCWNFDGVDDDVRFYVFNSLPFGLATAGHIFTKTLRCAVKHWREKGHRVIMFLDDGIGGQAQYADAEMSSVNVKETLTELGFLLAHDKCKWTPVKVSYWLGHKLDFDQNRLFITEERIMRLILAVESLLYQIQRKGSGLVPVRFVASVTGHIVSLQSVLGKVVCRKTRYLHKCIDSRVGWNYTISVDALAVSELRFWLENVRVLNSKGRDFRPSFKTDFCVFTDASNTGYGGYVALVIAGSNSERQGFGLCHKTQEVEICFRDTKVRQSFSGFRSLGVPGSKSQLPEVSSGLLELQEVSSILAELPEASTCLTTLPYASAGWSKLPEVSLGLMELPEESLCLELLAVSSGLMELPEESFGSSELIGRSERVQSVDLSTECDPHKLSK